MIGEQIFADAQQRENKCGLNISFDHIRESSTWLAVAEKLLRGGGSVWQILSCKEIKNDFTETFEFMLISLSTYWNCFNAKANTSTIAQNTGFASPTYPHWIIESLRGSITEVKLVSHFWLFLVDSGDSTVWSVLIASFLHIPSIHYRINLWKTNKQIFVAQVKLWLIYALKSYV